jgi:hypothetical protein
MLLGTAMFGLVLSTPAVTQAMPVHAEEMQTSAEERQTTARANAEERRAAQTRLADAKLKACQNREKAITNIMTRLGDRGQKQVDLFSKIADRTEAFYVKKGKTLTNYDALVADVSAKKTAAQTAVDTIKSTSVEFKCDGSDPKGVVASFKNSLKTEIAALKAYKTSVKNLIVGVKSVQGTTSSADNGGTN